MNAPLPRSLESRSREWLDTPPLYRTECPSCGSATAGTNSRTHGRGCWLLLNAPWLLGLKVK